ncbi:MAG TPA: transglutaminase-like domain-containing protein [Verrucomicrobiae bacterium]
MHGMSTTSIAQRPQSASLSESEQRALLLLLGDEDPQIYRTVRQRILAEGDTALHWVRPATLSNDPVERRRASEIIRHISMRHADDRFLAFILNSGEDLDIEEGILLLAQTEYPAINISGYNAILDDYAADLRERLDFGAVAAQMIATINEYLFKIQGYHGNEENYYEPENSYLNKVIDRRKGNPISLCLIYLLLARRLHLPITGIGMPGHFLCRFQTPTEELFIDAFNSGKILTKGDCVKYLLHTRDGFKEAYLAPITTRRTLLRVCSNLHQIYSQQSRKDDIARFQRYIVALAK